MLKSENEKFNEYKEVFQLYDKDNDGQIDEESLLIAMRTLGFYPTEAMKENIFKEMNKNEGDSYDFNEFFDIMQRKSSNEEDETLDQFIQKCVAFDRNESNSLTSGEIYQILNLGDKNLNEQEINEMISELTENGVKNEIPIDLFVRYMFAK